jgi:LysR family transcriptional regulator, glycine cleavage system transcriptional activator
MFLTSSTLASLRFFEAAARLLSFKRAAAELHVTQGAVSQQIKNLEAALGCKLFHRLPHQIAFTEEGQRFARVVESALEEIQREAQAIALERSAVDIRVRCGPSFALRWLVPRLGDFYSRHANIKLFVTAAYGYFDPTQCEFDLAIEMIEGDISALHTEALMDEYLTPVCSPAYLAEHEFIRTPTDLGGCTLLHDGHAWTGASEDAEWRHWLSAVGAAAVDSCEGRFFSMANMSIEAALTHQGIAMGRLSLIQDLLESGRLVMPFKDRVRSRAKYCMVYPRELADVPGIRAVVRWLREQAGHTNWDG